MAYSIMKTSNGEYKEINKSFKLNVSKYVGDSNTLYFDVEGKDIPFLMDYNMFFNVLLEQIQKGLIETLNYQDGIIKATFRDGNTIKNYTYDFSFSDFKNNLHNNHLDNLKRAVYKIVSMYKENPNNSLTSEQRYIWLIYDILDGDRIPIIEDKDELLRVFEVYNAHKNDFLESLLDNVIFHDDDGNIIEYRDKLRERKLDIIRYDVLNQMETAMLLFIGNNDAMDLYQQYMDNIYIPRREIQYVDENGNELEVPETEEGTLISLGIDYFHNKFSKVIQRIRKKN